MARRSCLTRKKRKQTIENDAESQRAAAAAVTANLHHNASLSINRLPVEIFSMIISLALSPTLEKPYPQIALCSICHRWRTLILHDALHWKVIVLGPRTMEFSFLNTLVIRSRPANVEIITSDLHHWNWGITKYRLKRAFRTDGFRVKTIVIEQAHEALFFMSIFPLLENLYFTPASDNTSFIFDLTLLSPEHRLKMLQITPCNLRYLQELEIPDAGNPGIEPRALVRQRILSSLHNIQWLRLDVFEGIRMVFILPALQHLPGLRVLHVCYRRRREFAPAIQFTAKFPNLEMLTIDHAAILGYIEAPKLAYLSVSGHAVPVVQDDSLFCGFDLSTITWLSTAIQFHPNSLSKPYLVGGNEFMEGTAYPSIKVKGCDLITGQSYLDRVPTFYPRGQVYLSLENFEDRITDVTRFTERLLCLCLRKTVNLVELIFNDFGHSFSTPDRLNYLIGCLRQTVTVRKLTILKGNGFDKVCLCLRDGRVCPRMETLVYHSRVNLKRSRHQKKKTRKKPPNLHLVFTCLDDLVRQRSSACLSPLKTVELCNYERLSPEVVQEIESLGLKYIQTP